MKPYTYIFGPVPSRRLGRSLGIDPVPLKTCSFDCVFCQLGGTTLKTVERREYAPIEIVKEELSDWLSSGSSADCITLAGSGEPTLHTRFGELLIFAKQHSRLPVVLFSNGAMFFLPEVRAAAAAADTVKVSLSAWDQASFERINKPHRDIAFSKVVSGLKMFRNEFDGTMWLEVFIVDGINSDRDSVGQIALLASGIGADRIHLNTAVRPAAGSAALVVQPDRLRDLAAMFEPEAEVIASFESDTTASRPPDAEAVLALLRRHPATAEQIASAFGVGPATIETLLRDLLKAGHISPKSVNGLTYHSIT